VFVIRGRVLDEHRRDIGRKKIRRGALGMTIAERPVIWAIGCAQNKLHEMFPKAETDLRAL
jgi:hypothetical protein